METKVATQVEKLTWWLGEEGALLQLKSDGRSPALMRVEEGKEMGKERGGDASMKPLLLVSLILFPLLMQQLYSGPDYLQLYCHVADLPSWQPPSL